MWWGVAAILTVAISSQTVLSERYGKLDFEYTLRGPYIEAPPSWDIAGAASLAVNSIRFTPQSMQSPGSLWSKRPVTMKSWEVILEFSVHGAAPLSTGEGLAFWHVSDPGSVGAVYGHSDKFSGLGIFFDSYDADNNGEGEPYVLAMYNQGTHPIDAEGAGLQLGVCFANYRNLPFPARAKIAFTAQDKHLTVGLDIENSGKFKSCISVKDVVVQPDIDHFGLTVSDYGSDFDIYSFLVVNLDNQVEKEAIKDDKDKGNMMEIVDDEEKNGRPMFESRASFIRILTQLQGLSGRLTSLDEQFSRQFQSVFHSHSKGLDAHISKVQEDSRNRQAEVGLILDTLNRQSESIQRMVSTLKEDIQKVSQRAPNKVLEDSSLVDQLAKTRLSCSRDNTKGESVITVMRGLVDTLERKQQEIKNDVLGTLNGMNTMLSRGCGGSTVMVLAAALVGAVIGAFAGSSVKVGRNRSHYL